MLTSFFSNSKPFHFIVVSLLLFVGCFIYIILDVNEAINYAEIATTLLQNAVVLLLFLLLSFIIKKNRLTKLNSYALFLFCCFILTNPILFKESEPVFSLLFLLLALRRILSISSKKNSEKKILDASIWITIAALFYFWSILFFIILFIAIIQLASKNYKLVFIPFVGFISIFILTTAYQVFGNDSLWWFLEYKQQISFDFSPYYSLKAIIPAIFIMSLGIFGILYKSIYTSNTPLKEKSKYWILIFSLLIGLILIVLTNNKNGSELIFLLAPISIFTTNFLETISKKWISELFLWLVFVFPIVIYFL
ncbi:MAG: hypothetical protein ACI93N_002542 [Flavobacteriaceae bacterium]|jgi:hypothetical protein